MSTVADFPPLPPGCRYELVRFHAEGGLGRVYLGRDVELGREVAVKLVRPELARSGTAVGRFKREAEITGRLEHPAVVPVYGLLPLPDGSFCYAMRFLQGRTLAEAIADFHARPADPRERRRLLGHFVAVCKAVGFAHSREVIHRDLKPANVMLGEFGETWVLDWGLAKQLGEPTADSTLPPTRLSDDPTDTPVVGPTGTVAAAGPQTPDGFATEQGQVFGTPSHMAPEQARGEAVGPPADVWALGAVLYELLSGRPPYRQESLPARLQAARECRYDPLPARLPRPLAAVCRKAMSREPGDRYGSAGELAADVDRWLAGEPVAADREPWPERAGRWARRYKTLAVSGVAAVLVGLLAAAGFSEAGRRRAAADELRVRGERDRANANMELADRVAGDVVRTVLDNPKILQDDFSETRREMLGQIARVYQELAPQRAEAAGLGVTTARADRLSGQLARERGELTPAADAFRRAEAVLSARPDDPTAAEELGRVRSELGRVLHDLGRLPDAATVLAAARDGLAAAGRTDTSPRLRHFRAVALNNLGLVLHSLGRHADSEAAYRDGLAVTDGPRAAPPDPLFDPRADAALLFSNLGSLLRDTRRPADARAAFERAVALQDEAATARPDLRSYRRQAAAFRANLGAMLFDFDQPDAAARQYEQALRELDALVADFPSVPEYQVVRGRMALNYAQVRARRKADAPGVLDAAREAVAALSRIADRHPEVVEFASAHAAGLGTYAQVLTQAGRPADARPLYEQSAARYRALADRYLGEPYHRRNLAAVLGDLGGLAYNAGDYPAAERVFHQQLTECDRLAREYPGLPGYADALALAAYNVGMAVVEQPGRVSEALPHYDRAVALLAGRVDGTTGGPAQNTLRNAHWGRADVHVRLGRHAAAVPEWRATIALIPDDEPDRLTFRLELADSLQKSGNRAAAVAEAAAVVAHPRCSPSRKVDAAAVAVAAGAADRAMEWLTAALTDPALGDRRAKLVERLKTDATFAPLRGRPDFQTLLAGAGK